MNWNDYLTKMNKVELRYTIAWLLGRSGISDEEFISRCKIELGEEE